MIIIGHRVALFLTINTDHIDCDQPIMWNAARNFSEGLFYEPRYYGQDYNTMLEGLLAVPLLWLGIPVYYAVAAITHFLFLFPFLFTALYLFIKKKKPQALFVLILLVCMPLSYDIMNSLSRGFVTGLFFTSFYILSIQNPSNLKYLFLNTFLGYVAYLVNPNSLLVSAPFLFYLFLANIRNKKYYYYSGAALLLAYPIDYFLNHFYKVNPEYIRFSFKNEFSLSYFKDAITHLNQRFAHISFFLDENCLLLLLSFLGIGFVLFKQNKKAFYSLLLFFVLILLTFTSSKIADGLVWAFYSYSRMYLAIPVLFYLLMSLISYPSKKLLYVVIAVTFGFTIYKEVNLRKEIAYHTDPKKWLYIHLMGLETSLDIIDHYKIVCEKNKVNNFVIAGDHFAKDEIGYGGPAVYKNFPNTLLSYCERRTWKVRQERLRVVDRFILLIPDYDLDKKGYDVKYGFKITRQDYYGCFLIENNKTSMVQFLELIDQPVNGIRYYTQNTVK